MQFWRIVDGRIHNIGDVKEVGFKKADNTFIPDDYLNNQVFTVCRTCLGIGDWGIISAMPRLLKEKYPNCTVQLPSESLLKSWFEPFANEWLKSWSNPYKTMEYIFRNNPYVDSFTDTIMDEVFHDHYRIYQHDEPETPLLEQMLHFWQFTPDEYADSAPEVYFNDKEKALGDAIISKYGSNGFGTILLSNRFQIDRDKDFIKEVLAKHKVPYFYWISDPALKSLFDVDYAFDLRHTPIRVQMYIKTQATLVVGNQSGADSMFPRYTKVYMSPKTSNFGSNITRGSLIIKKEDI
jgi:hypothetical protein